MSVGTQKGTFVISLDTEMAWGGVDRPMPDRRRAEYRQTRELVGRLLTLFEKYETRATWAIVGHLFLDRCETTDGTKHPEVVRPNYSWYPQDWFTNDPCTDRDTDSEWYGRDIVEAVMACRVPQEIGSHGFSHMIVGDPGCSREAFASELRAFDSSVRPFDLSASSFVFPRNAIGHLDLLKEHGYRVYRGVSPTWYGRFPRPVQKMCRALESVAPTTPPTVQARQESGLWNVPASYNYLHRSGWARRVPMSVRVSKGTRGLKRAAADGSVFHLWFHPFNLASDPANLLDGLEKILSVARDLRESGRLVNRTMGDFASVPEPVR